MFTTIAVCWLHGLIEYVTLMAQVVNKTYAGPLLSTANIALDEQDFRPLHVWMFFRNLEEFTKM